MEITILALNCDIPFFTYLKRELETKLNSIVLLKTINLPMETYDQDRKQYDAKKLLDRIAKEHGEKVVGITDKDIYFDGMSFIFGLSNVSGRHCLISLARLNPSFYNEKGEDKFKERLLKELFHELGHTVGLLHCTVRSCTMSFSDSAAELDNKKEFCHNCNEKFRKV